MKDIFDVSSHLEYNCLNKGCLGRYLMFLPPKSGNINVSSWHPFSHASDFLRIRSINGRLNVLVPVLKRGGGQKDRPLIKGNLIQICLFFV